MDTLAKIALVALFWITVAFVMFWIAGVLP